MLELSEECNMLGVTETEKEQWLAMGRCETGVQNMTDEDIMVKLKRKKRMKMKSLLAPPSHTRRLKKLFSTCMAWLEQQDEATPMNLMLLRELRS